MKTGLEFKETMNGWVSFTETDYNQALLEGRRAGRTCDMRLRIDMPDIESFVAEDGARANVTGTVTCDELGPPMEIVEGYWVLGQRAPDDLHVRMRYRLWCKTADKEDVTVSGFKLVENDPGPDRWVDLTSLFMRILRGHVEAADERPELVLATGVAFVRPLSFLRQLATYRARGGSWLSRRKAIPDFVGAFVRAVDLYWESKPGDTHPSFPSDPELPATHQPGVWHELRERPGVERRFVPYHTEDGLTLDLHHLQLRDGPKPSLGPVILSHGAAGRPAFFYLAPMRTTFAEALLAKGYDVWVMSWRGSIDHHPRRWSLDEVAAYDHPAAIKKVLEETQRESVKAVAQCQGSTSLTLALVAGKVPEITHALLSQVSLHPRTPFWSQAKTQVLLPTVGRFMPFLDAQWGIRPPTPPARAVALAARLARRECDDPACAFANFMWGAGPDLLWLHANLEDDVHHFLSREFGWAPTRFYRQMWRSIKAGHLVHGDNPPPGLGKSYLDAPKTTAHITFAYGTENRLFLPEGQKESHKHFSKWQPDRSHLLEWRRYSHIDPWLGRNAESEVFESAIEALER
jgi:hypothetical protein